MYINIACIAYSLLCVCSAGKSVVPESIDHLISLALVHVTMLHRTFHSQVPWDTLPRTLTFQNVVFSNLRHIHSDDLSQENVDLSVARATFGESGPLFPSSLDVVGTAVPVWPGRGTTLDLGEVVGERFALSQSVFVQRLKSAEMEREMLEI